MTRFRHHPPITRGTTLLELVVYVGLIGLVLTSVVAFAAEFLTTALKANLSSEVAWNAHFAMGRLTAEIRQAASFDEAASAFGTNPSRLTLCAAAPCASGNETVFGVTDGRLTVSVNGGEALPLTAPQVRVEEFTVTNLSTETDRVRSRNFAVRMKVVGEAGGLFGTTPEATYLTTERLRRYEGFAE